MAVEVPQRRGDPLVVATDEEPGRGRPEKFGKLRPAFDREGTITAANASSINDGASAMVLMSREKAEELGIEPLGRIVGTGKHAQAPEWFTTAPAKATANAIANAQLELSDVDLFEINEAFSVVALAVARELGADLDKVNVRGGAVALGHPIGCSGNRIVVTLLHALRQTGKKYGAAGICLGGGEGIALVVEAL